MLVLTFHWLKVVWSRTSLQLAAEQERRQKTAEAEQRTIWGDQKD
ncbi:putative transmembrane domain protein [Rhodococcus sp. MTM3W5.2]|nr:putative transmembrane domain protein [Rhodococcus sp. MTM3W5.2]